MDNLFGGNKSTNTSTKLSTLIHVVFGVGGIYPVSLPQIKP